MLVDLQLTCPLTTDENELTEISSSLFFLLLWEEIMLVSLYLSKGLVVVVLFGLIYTSICQENTPKIRHKACANINCDGKQKENTTSYYLISYFSCSRPSLVIVLVRPSWSQGYHSNLPSTISIWFMGHLGYMASRWSVPVLLVLIEFDVSKQNWCVGLFWSPCSCFFSEGRSKMTADTWNLFLIIIICYSTPCCCSASEWPYDGIVVW